MRHEPVAEPLRKTGGLLGLLGLGRARHAGLEDCHSPQRDYRRARQLLAKAIGDFLIDNDLDITPANLAIAHSLASGLNPGLRRRVEQRYVEGQAITQQWLEREVAGSDASADRVVEELVEKLEQGISDFSRSTRDARTATSRYGDVLEAHVGQLERRPASKSAANREAGEVISQLAGFARLMLERSREAEAELRHSEEEAATLRRNLEAAQRDAEIDALTGLPNRRAFEARLAAELTAAKAAGEPLSIAFCDIDRFKAVNDTHGHEAGDRILCVVARALSGISGSRCHIARHGGEEFAVLFRGSTPDEAHVLLDRVRHELAQRRLVNRRTEQPFGQISFSGGIADIFAYRDAREALAAADEALYQAKEGGRNRVLLANQR